MNWTLEAVFINHCHGSVNSYKDAAVLTCFWFELNWVPARLSCSDTDMCNTEKVLNAAIKSPPQLINCADDRWRPDAEDEWDQSV